MCNSISPSLVDLNQLQVIHIVIYQTAFLFIYSGTHHKIDLLHCYPGKSRSNIHPNHQSSRVFRSTLRHIRHNVTRSSPATTTPTNCVFSFRTLRALSKFETGYRPPKLLDVQSVQPPHNFQYPQCIPRNRQPHPREPTPSARKCRERSHLRNVLLGTIRLTKSHQRQSSKTLRPKSCCFYYFSQQDPC